MAGRSLNEVIIDLEHQHSAKEDFIAPARGMRMQEDGATFEINHAKLTRSMSRKGCSPDNAACEAFFGRLKTEMFYNHSWMDVSIEDFVNSLDNYIHWYATGRIKLSLGAMSPVEL